MPDIVQSFLSEELDRGVRNNNWLNIRYNAKNDWLGQDTPDEGGYARFKDPLYSLRAADIILTNYGEKHGLTTVKNVVERWAPQADNNPTSEYVNYVADRLGLSPDEEINTSDPVTREKLIAAMVPFETPDAADLYSSAMVNEARSLDQPKDKVTPIASKQPLTIVKAEPPQVAVDQPEVV